MRILVLLLCFSLVACLNAQEVPEAPKPKTRRLFFYVGAGALAGAATYDWKTTSELIHRGGWEKNSSWAIGRRPSDAQIGAFGSAWTSAEVAGFRLTEQSRRWWIRWAGRAYVAWAVQEHIRLARRNTRL